MVVTRGPGQASDTRRRTVDGAGKIVVSGLTKRFGTVTAVDDLSFTVEPGTITGFLGPNGAGKTTTLRMLLGLVTPDAGSATIGGRPYRDLPRPYDAVGAALEATGFHPARSGRNHLRVYCTVNGYPRRRADEVLDLVGLSGAGRRAVGGYSLGMRQRLALATALLGDPRVLVLDEPANGLDPEGIAWLRRLLRDLAAKGKTLLVSSHLLAEAQQLVHHVVIIHRGRCVRQGSLADLAAGYGPVVRVRTPQVDRLSSALAQAGVPPERVERTGPDQLRVTGLDAEPIGRLAFRERVEVLWLAAGAAKSLVAVLAAIGLTGEFRHKTVTATFLATPHRGRVVAAKLVTYAVVGAGYGLVCIGVVAAIALAWLSTKGIHVTMTGNSVPATLAGVIATVAVFAVLGVGLGALLRDQVATVVALLIYLFVAEPIITRISALGDWTRYLPGPAASALTQVTLDNQAFLHPWQGGLVLAVYGVAFAIAGTLLAVRRDVT